MADEPAGEKLIEKLRFDLCARWRNGERVSAEAYLREHPTLQADTESALQLVYQEVLLREELGEPPQLAEYAKRFPELAARLEMLFVVHEALEAGGVLDATQRRAIQREQTDEACPVVPGYEILGVLGRGGMGVVYQARHQRLNRIVALKMIRAGTYANADDLARFRIEAEAQARLQHPHIVQIFEIGEADGRTYLSLEYVDGGSLAQHTDGTPQPEREAAELVATLARAVHVAHGHGLIHRDLKPVNILRTGLGIPKITDFGLAKCLTDRDGGPAASGPSQRGSIVGTPSYMAPEQAEGRTKAVGPAADVYSLGAILYELLTGRPPFLGETGLQTLTQVLAQEPVPPRLLRPTISRDLETICLKCLAKQPARRYPSAQALADDLERWLADKPIAARPVHAVERAVKWARRQPALAALVGVSVLAALALVGLLVGLVYHGQLQDALDEAQQGRQGEQEQRVRAEQAQLDEARARKIAEQEKTEKAAALDRAADYLYSYQIHLAQREWSTNSPDRARQHLEMCTPERRGWEWHYLKRLCTIPKVSLQSPSPMAVGRASFRADGQRFAAACADRVVRIWDTSTGEVLRELKGHEKPVTHVAFSPNGQWVASGGQDPFIKLWNASTGELVRSWPVSPGPVFSLAFDSRGQRVAASTLGGVVLIWNVNPKFPGVVTFPTGIGPVTSLAFSPDGQYLATGGSVIKQAMIVPDAKVVNVWRIKDVQTFKRKEVLSLSGHTATIRDLTFSAGGKYLAAASEDQTARVWNAATGETVATLRGHHHPVRAVAFDPEGQRLATAGTDGSVRIEDLAGRLEPVALRGHRAQVVALAFRTPGHLLSVSSDGTLHAWDLAASREAITLQGHGGRVTALAFSPDGQFLASGSADRTVRFWNPMTGEEIHPLREHKGPVLDVAFSPDGQRLASAGVEGMAQGTVHVWQAAGGTKVVSFAPPKAGRVRGVAFRPLGDSLAFVMEGIKTSQLVFRKPAKEQPPEIMAGRPLQHREAWCLAFSPDGRLVATAGNDGAGRAVHVITVRDADSHQEVLSLKGHADTITRIAFSPSGKLLASASRDQTVKVWDAATWQEVFTARGHTHRVTAVAFSPDGRRLASADENGEIKLWDVATGHETLTLRGHGGPVRCVAFSADGRLLASGGDDMAIRLWDGSPSP